jgi:hypothetical protein
MSRRPLLIRAFNSLVPNNALNADKLLASAEKKTGLYDFGDEAFKEGFTRLIDSINKSAALHSFGSFISKQRLVNVLSNRLRAADIIKKHPEILEIEIKSPIIITGLQRTGTTRLHRLLSAHPEVRALRSWEALNPVALPNDEGNKKRIAFAKTAERALKYMSPEFFAIHPVEHLAPEEDILLNDMSFVSTVPEATMHVPEYAAWVELQRHLMPYQYLKQLLQILSFQQPQKRWVLKTPQYLEFLDEALEVFPDAKCIHTFRDPLKVLPSFFSMVYHSRRVFSDAVSKEVGARHWLKKNKHGVDKAMKYWNQHGEEKFMHVSYYNMLQHAEEEMRKIYAFTELAADEKVLAGMQAVNEENKQYKYGVHRYDLKDFNVSAEEIDEAFADYRKKFNIPYE